MFYFLNLEESHLSFLLYFYNTQQFSKFCFGKQKQILRDIWFSLGPQNSETLKSRLTFHGNMVICMVCCPPFYQDIIGQVECATWPSLKCHLWQWCSYSQTCPPLCFMKQRLAVLMELISSKPSQESWPGSWLAVSQPFSGG